MKRWWLLLLLLFVSAPALAQDPCVFCHGQTEVRQLKYRDGMHPVCGLCIKRLPTCLLCGQPTKAAPAKDGRLICQFCRKVGVFSQTELDSIFAKIRKYVDKELGGEVVSPSLYVQIADKDELQTKLNEGGRAVDANGFYQPYNPEKIYILTGLTRGDCSGVAAHEYTHAWQSRNCPSQDRALTEGFACWVQYHYLVSAGFRDDAKDLLGRSDADYGQSLHKLLEMEKKVGMKKVIEFARTARDL